MFYLEVEEKKQSLLYIPPLKLTPKGSWKSMVGRWHLFLFGARPIFRDCISSGSVLPTENPPIFPGRHFRKFFSLRLRPQKPPPESTRNSSKMAHLWCHLRVGSTFDWQFWYGLRKCINHGCWKTQGETNPCKVEMWKMIFLWVVSFMIFSWVFVFFGGFLRSTQPKFNKSYATHEKR